MATRAVARDTDERSHPSWSGQIAFTVWLIPEGDHWSALAEDFDVAGVGANEEAAIRNMEELLVDYFCVARDEGLSVEQARRPIPMGTRLRLEWGRLRGSLSGRLDFDSRPRIHREAHDAHC